MQGICLPYDHVRHMTGIHHEKVFWEISVPVTLPYMNGMLQEYFRHIQFIYGNVTDTEISQKKFSWCMPVIRHTWSYGKHMPYIFQVYPSLIPRYILSI